VVGREGRRATGDRLGRRRTGLRREEASAPARGSRLAVMPRHRREANRRPGLRPDGAGRLETGADPRAWAPRRVTGWKGFGRTARTWRAREGASEPPIETVRKGRHDRQETPRGQRFGKAPSGFSISPRRLRRRGRVRSTELSTDYSLLESRRRLCGVDSRRDADSAALALDPHVTSWSTVVPWNPPPPTR
jgi:hypothetical protein